MNEKEFSSNHLRILITNAFLSNRTGTELFVRDIALELHQRGHIPVIYAPQTGLLAQELRDSGILVVNDLQLIHEVPDLIHGQHRLETMASINRFPGTPAIFFCHGVLPWREAPFLHPRIMYYVALSEMIRRNMISKYNIPSTRIARFSNFVDLERFRSRSSHLPLRPGRALIFSNQANETNFVNSVRTACSQSGIKLDVVGIASGTATSTPEALIQEYDIVFARGRAALEALAVGAAVICCDIEGLGSMVTTGNWDWYQRYNFGLHTLTQPITAGSILVEISKYDPIDAIKVSQITREKAGMSIAINSLLTIYRDCIFRNSEIALDISRDESAATSDFVHHVTLEFNMLHEQNHLLLSELNAMNSTITSRIRRRVVASASFRKLYTFFRPYLKTSFSFLKTYVRSPGRLIRRLRSHRKLALYHKGGANPILIYQMGKVGSTSVKVSLEEAYQDLGLSIPVRHRHVLNQLDEYEQAIRREWQDPERALLSIDEGRRFREYIYNHPEFRWNVVSLVRDPVARNISAFFENLSKIIPNWKEQMQTDILDIDGLQKIFVDGKWIHFRPEGWFDSQLKPIFDIDVYTTPFPRKKGFDIYQNSKPARLLVIRMEDLDRVGKQAMHDFLGLEDFKLNQYNVSNNKDYAETYKAFKQLPLPTKYVGELYGNRFARHFYNDQELEAFAKRWLAK